MAYKDIVNVDIALNATALTQKGFGTIGFMAATTNFAERVRAYSSLEEILQDGFVATNLSEGEVGDSVFRAALAAFGESPRPSYFKVLRRQTGFATYPVTLGTAGAYEMTIAFDKRILASESYPVSFNALDVDDAEIICNGLKAAAELVPELVDRLSFSVVGTLNNAALEISAIDGDTFFVVDSTHSMLELGTSENSTEPGSVTAAYATAEDDDYYFVASEDISDSYVLELSDYIQTVDKMYFVSTNEVAAISDPANSLVGQLRENRDKNTVALFHHTAYPDNSMFPELAFIGNNSVYDAGSITWCNIQPSISASEHPELNRRLSISEKTNLNSIDCNYADWDSGVTFIRTGKTCSDNFIDEIRGIHWLDQQITLELKSLLLNQAGGKVPYNNTGRMLVENSMRNALQRAVNRQFIDEFTVYVPELEDIPNNDRVNRILNDVSFTGKLTGAIHEINVIGTVSPL